MAVSITEKIKGYREDLSKLQKAYDQTQGALDTKMKMLKDKFGFDDILLAQKQLKKYEKEVVTLEQELESSLASFEKKYKDFLPSLGK